MRIALVNNLFVDQLGVFYISAVLKQAGHDVRMFVTDNKLVDKLRAYDPGLVGFTAVTGNHLWAAETAEELREEVPNAKFILGGPHPTYHPEIIRHPGFDFICRGEGEYAIRTLVDRLERQEDTTTVPGIWAKVGDQVFENPFHEQIEDLDALPFPDRSLYDAIPMTRRQFYPFMISSRGCPWKCTFCYAPKLAELTRDRGKFVRFRSVDNVIAEALHLKDEYKIRSIEFVDDIFGMHRPWLREFSRRWREEVGLPFQCNLRADLVTEESVTLLAEAGCSGIAFGLESGNERVRNEILQKEVTTDQIREAVKLLKQHKIRVVTYNVLGSPTESLEEAWDTVRLNQEIKPDYAWVSLMQPYPGTAIYDLAVKNGVFEEDEFDQLKPFYHDTSPLRIKHVREVNNLQKLLNLAVWFPRLTPVVRWMTRMPENPLYYVIFLSTHVIGLYFRVKRVPSVFLMHLLLNIKEVRRRHKSGLYKRVLPDRTVTPPPTVREQLERGGL